MGKSSARMACIYGLVDPLDPGSIRYIGRTVDLVVRLKSHVSTAKSGKWITYKDNWIRSLLSRGSRPSIIQLTDWMNYEESGIFEVRMINEARASGCSLTNTTDGGEGCVGSRPSEESRRKMSATRKALFASGKISSRKVVGFKKTNFSSSYAGVRLNKSGSFKVVIKICDKRVSAGTFLCEREAAMAYDKLVRDNGLENAILNFPDINQYPEFTSVVSIHRQSPATIAKKVLVSTGRKRSQAAIDKFRAFMTGRPMSSEAIAGMRKPKSENARRNMHATKITNIAATLPHGFYGVCVRHGRYRVILTEGGKMVYRSKSFDSPFDAALSYDSFVAASGRLWLPINFKEIL